MQPEIVSTEYVKPSASTPQNHPTIHNLSFFDKLQPPEYMPLLYFYTSRDGETDPNHRSSLLKSSLSDVLSHYYPLAGRIKDNNTVDCNDEGALFLEARMECDLSEILSDPLGETVRHLCPDSLCYNDPSFQTILLVVQVTYFKCGGASIGLAMSHKIMDMAGMSCFINEWASLARNPDIGIKSPEFNIGDLYRKPIDLPLGKLALTEMKGLVWRRLVFRGSKIADLKQRVADQVPNPTRVEVVSALLYKSAISASASSTLEPSVMNHVMNLRAHVNPPLSSRNKGNMGWFFGVLSTPGNKEATIGWLVTEFRRSKSRLSDLCASASNGEELCSLLLEGVARNVEHQVYNCTSWCRYPFYESDFGWGKPLWVTPSFPMLKNVLCLVDTREGDGIEAYICLEDKAMAAFEQDEQLLSFCMINPSIVDA